MFWYIALSIIVYWILGATASAFMESKKSVLRVLGSIITVFLILFALWGFYSLISDAIISKRAKKDYATLSTPGYLRNQVIRTTHDLYGKDIRDSAGLLLGGMDVGRRVPLISTLINEVDGVIYDESIGKRVWLKAVYGITPEGKIGICVKNNSTGGWKTDTVRTSIYNKYRKQYLENLLSFKKDGRKELKQGINPNREYRLRDKYDVPYAISLEDFVLYHMNREEFRNSFAKAAFAFSESNPQIMDTLLFTLQKRMPQGSPARNSMISYGAYKYNIPKNKFNNDPSKRPFKTNKDGSFKNINEIAISYNSVKYRAFDVITTKGDHYYIDVDMFGSGIKDIMETPMIVRDSITRPRYWHVKNMIGDEIDAYRMLSYWPDVRKDYESVYGRNFIESLAANESQQQCDSVCRVIFNEIIAKFDNSKENEQ